MSEFEIRIPARKKQPATDKDNPSLLIVEGSKHVVYDKEE